MDAPVVTGFDTGIPPVENEIQLENSETTLSASRQEVNKPADVDNESSKIVDREDESLISYASENCVNGSPKKSVKRNVSFPAESPVIGYLDPPDPWKNVPNWKTEDLVKAYRFGCEKHGTRPLNKIIQQLSCIENVGERYEILSLKGERLDIKQSESLEEIFKHVRFRCLDLEATHLDDETAVAIFDMVEYYESACKLNISFNKNIGGRGWQACSKLIRKTPCLTFIDAKNCDLNERVMPILGRSLRMGCYLTRLHLQSVGLAGRALIILVAALKMNETLKELFIGDNKLMSTDGIQVGNLLKFNHKLELLDLRNNHLQDAGVHHVCEGLSEQTYGSGLLTLVLWNNQISFQAMSDISQALVRTESLETLNLGHNPITNEGIHLVKDGLLKSKSLLKLGLSGTKVSCEGAVALAEVIADTPRIVRLDLQENDIKTAGLMALSLALKVNKSLSRLDLDKDTKKEQGIKDYAEQQRRLQQDIKTYLDRNRDLAHKLLKERETVTKIPDKVLEEDLEKARTEEIVETSDKDGETDLISEENDLIADENFYIPSEDKISRPKLLFLPERSPESDLESPACVPEHIDLLHPLQTAVEQQDVVSLTLPVSSAQDLLSPQYCPKMTAKKLFSVTRVTSPTLGPPGNSLLDSKNQNLPISHICTPLSSVPATGPLVPSLTLETLNLDTSSQVEVNSCLIQQKLKSESFETYIQEITDSEKDSLELDTEIANKDLISDSAIAETEDEKSVELNSVTEETLDIKTDELSEKSVAPVNRLSAGDGPIKEADLETDKADADDLVETETVSNRTSTDTINMCDHNNSATNIQTECSGKDRDGSKIVKTSQLSAVKHTGKPAFAESEDSKLTRDSVHCKTGLQIKDANTVQSDSVTSESNLNTDVRKQVLEENFCTDGSDTHCVPGSYTVDPSDDQLDSIEIIPEEDISEIKLGSDEPPELLDCDTSSELSNNAYHGLTDSLCDMVLPFEWENDNIAENANLNNSLEKGVSDDNAKSSDENEKISLNSKTNGHFGDSGIRDNDPEQWSKVEKSDICDKVTDQETSLSGDKATNKPDFHTSLSLNGLKQELASLIDDDGNPTKGASQSVLKSPVSPEDIIPKLSDVENLAQKPERADDVHANGK